MDKTILIVDDESNIRNSLSRRYKLKGYIVETAEDGNDALTKMEEKAYRVVISDIKMPNMDGVELLRHIRKDYPMTRVIMMTGYVTLDNALACLRHGADTCIFKPFEDLSEMDTSIESALKYLKHWEDKLTELKNVKSEN